MGLIERFVDEQEEAPRIDDWALKDGGRFRLGAFEGPEAEQFVTVEGMIAAVDAKLRNPPRILRRREGPAQLPP